MAFRQAGFSLAELLTVIWLLGIISVYTIPKVITSQSNAKYNSMAKEAMATVAQALQNASLRGQVTTNTSMDDLISQISYVKLDTSTTNAVQDRWGSQYNCSSGDKCIRMHNGGTLLMWGTSFVGTSNLNAIEGVFDPDGTGSTPGVWVYLYYNGRLATQASCSSGTLIMGSVRSSCPGGTNGDPTWFRW